MISRAISGNTIFHVIRMGAQGDARDAFYAYLWDNYEQMNGMARSGRKRRGIGEEKEEEDDLSEEDDETGRV